MKRKVLSFVLVVVMMVGMWPMVSVSVGAAKSFSSELTRLQDKFPDGRYWNGGDSNKTTGNACTCHSSKCYAEPSINSSRCTIKINIITPIDKREKIW